MGTRNLTMVIRKQKPVIAQYGQWDGYPEGQGTTVLNFLKKRNLKKFNERLDHVRFSTEEDDKEREAFFESIGSKDGWMNMEQAELYHKKYPYLTRDNGAKILDMIYMSKGEVVLQDSSDFAADSLFCEWAYVVDLDKKVLEVYTGFNAKPLPKKGQRFANLPPEENTGLDRKYWPIKCIKKYKLSELPTVKQFCKELKDLTHDEDDE